jgi:hypothetical protein
MIRSLLAHVAVLGLLGAPVAAQKNVETDPQVVEGLKQLREATKMFKSIDSAATAGYVREVPACLVHEHHGAMGYHHPNRGNLDEKAEITKPEILLYERLADGSYRLNGVEYIVPYRFWPRDTIGPTIMGQRMKREDNLQFWYLHAWAWTPNKDGVFADFHPDVKCVESTSRVFKPFIDPTKP